MNINNLLVILRAIFDPEKINKSGEVFTYVGDNYFNFAADNVTEILQVKINNTPTTSGDVVDLNTDYNQMYLDAELTLGDVIHVVYRSTQYSDEELTSYLQEALVWFGIYTGSAYTVSGDDLTITPALNLEQQNLIALIAMILIKPYEQSYQLPNYKVVYPTRKDKDERIKILVSKGLKSFGTVMFT
jgi:hypothetical protein